MDTRSKTSVSEAEAEPEAAGGQVEMPWKSADVPASDLVLHFMDLLNEDNVLRKMKAVLYPNELASKIDNMQATISSMAKQLQENDNKITLLQAKVSNLEGELETQQQYTRRPNIRIYGIREPTENDNTDGEVLSLNDTLKLSPPITLQDIEWSHRVGRRVSAALLAPVPLSIFRSNSKFDENSERSSFKSVRPITTIFCTRHDSDTVVTCAKYRCDQPRIFYTRVFWIFIEFRIRSKYA